MTEEERHSKSELVARIKASRVVLQDILQNYSEAELSAPGPEGWSVKDHLAHLATWELGVARLLKHQDRNTAMGPEAAALIEQKKSEEEINEGIHQAHAGKSLRDVMAYYESAQQEMLDALEPLSDEDLYRPYSFYAGEKNSTRQDPVISWIVGDTFGHYEEHQPWIQTVLDSVAKRS